MPDYLFHLFPNERFVDLGLYQFGWEHCEPLHSFGPFTRNHYLFHYVISGTGYLDTNDSRGVSVRHQIYSGQGFLISPREVTTYCADADHPLEYCWLEFDGVRVREALELAGLSNETPIYKSSSKDLSKLLLDEMLYIVKHGDDSPFQLIGHLYLFMDYLTRSSASKKVLQSGSIRDNYVKEAINYIEQNFQNDISIEDIAVFCRLNRSYFGTIFKETIGKTPQEFLISYRMSKAAQLLKLTKLSIADISNAVGYPDQLHFSRAFKNVYGVSPRLWRKNNEIAPENDVVIPPGMIPAEQITDEPLQHI